MFGFNMQQYARGSITWIMVSPHVKALALGREMMTYAKNLAIEKNLNVVDIAESHLSAPFLVNWVQPPILLKMVGAMVCIVLTWNWTLTKTCNARYNADDYP
ncbi:MAG: hypothetical protein HRU25_14330 [Psychrobium sp.]|nr:hypothetical protein [Psychrobium sp.]